MFSNEARPSETQHDDDNDEDEDEDAQGDYYEDYDDKD